MCQSPHRICDLIVEEKQQKCKGVRSEVSTCTVYV